MKVNGEQTRSVWVEADGVTVGIIDQTLLPYRYVTLRLETVADAARAIKSMQVRGAPLIGAVAAYGMALAMREDASDAGLEHAYALLIATRPTAINLKWALDEMMAAVRNRARAERVEAAYKRAQEIADEDVEINAAIGRHGLKLIEQIAATKKPGEPVNVLTHCNAGWLATVDWAPRPHRSIRRTTRAFRSMSGSTRRARATRAPRSPPGSSASMACRTP